MQNPNFWNQVFIWPIVNVLLALYNFFEWIGIPGPLGFAVIGMTILIRLLLYPLMHVQMKSAKKMQSLKPHLDALNEKHKDNKQALQQAQLDLYKEHGVNPASGCLPILVQMPVLIALYNVFYQVLGNGNITQIVKELNSVAYASWLRVESLDLTFLGVNLGLKPEQWQTQGWWLLSVPIITGALQWYQSKLMMPQAANPVETGDKSHETSKKKKHTGIVKVEEKKHPTSTEAAASKEDAAMEMQKQMAVMMPIMFGYFALQFPLGLALYWNVFGIFGIMQQLKVNKDHK